MTINKSAVHSVVQLFISFHSVLRSFVFTGERSVVRLFVNSIIRPSVCPFGCSFARAAVQVRSFAFLVCSVVPPLAQSFLLSMGINML